MKNKLKVLVLFGTRPELIKLWPVVERLRAAPDLKPLVVATGQHREMVEGLLPEAVRPDLELNLLEPGQSLTRLSARTMEALAPVLTDERPDLLLVQGDTTSAVAAALAAFYHRIPVGHVEAGLRSFDVEHPFPEEVQRRLISAVGTLHFAPLESNERNLLREGVDAEAIHVTGNTVIDALQAVREHAAGALDDHLPAELLDGRRLALVTAHRRESFDEHLAELCRALAELVTAHPDLLVVYPVHLNPNVRREVVPLLGSHERVLLLDPLPYPAFVEAMARSHLIVTDSGGVQEEAPALGKPVLVFRKVTERSEGVAAQGAKIVGLDRRRLVEEASRLLRDEEAYREMSAVRGVYGDGRASERIVQAIRHHFFGDERPARFVAPASETEDAASQRRG